ncbi:MAG: FAD synthetase [Bacteroidales bacterium]|nr:FAD synthetase [Bacteroidales bacterium]
MRVFYGFDGLEKISNAVLTTGSFDGVHYGHKIILRRLNKLARQNKGESVLITFYPHPRKVLYPDTLGKDLRMIASMDEKIELLEREGLDNLVFVKFTPEFARISGQEFIEKYVFASLKPKVIVVGFNHHFGHNKEGDYSYLKSVADHYGFMAEEIPEQEVQNETVSSTEIRKALSEGYIQRVNAYLDHYYFITARCSECKTNIKLVGDSRYLLGVEDEEKLLPLAGSYAVSIPVDGSVIRGLAIMPPHEGGSVEAGLMVLDEAVPPLPPASNVKINFHKRMSGFTGNSEADLFKVPESLVNETRELVY